MDSKVHTTEHDQERPKSYGNKENERERRRERRAVVNGEVGPDVPRNDDTEHSMVTGKAPVLAAVKWNDGWDRWAGQTQTILACT